MRIVNDVRRYPMGLGASDFLKIGGIFSLVTLGVIVMILVAMMIAGAVMGAEFFCGFCFMSIALLIAGVFTGLILILLFYAKSAIYKKFPNHVEISGSNMIVSNTWSGMYPTIQNHISLHNIKRIERPNDDYFRERWEKTNWLFKANMFTHRPPHGGLYVPYTSKKNLLILHLREPVPISNTNFLPSRRPPMMKISEEFVREVIVDIDRKYQDDLINEIMMRNRVI